MTTALAPRLEPDAQIVTLGSIAASPAAGHITGQVSNVNGGAYLGR